MSAGTLTLTNKSETVTGNGTAFITELASGAFIVATVGGISYTLPVKSVNNSTSVTLVNKYTGPTQSGVAWNAVSRDTQNQVTAALVVQSTEALRGLNYDKQNWQQFFTAEGDVTITLPDNSQITGPSAKKLISSVITIDEVRSLIDAICPVGMMINWPSVVLPDNTSLGVKYLRLNGASFSKTLYPKLGAIYTSGVLPDVRGDVVRGYDDGRGIDQGRAILSEQADAIQNITATLNVRGMPGLSTGLLFSASGAFSLSSGTGASVLGATGATSSTAMDVLSFSAENVARTATETRMRNMAWNMIVRAT